MSNFWDDPPPVVKIHNFFFFRMITSLSEKINSFYQNMFQLYRVFFIEGQIRIGFEMPKILLFHVGFGFRTEVTMGYLISDHI